MNFKETRTYLVNELVREHQKAGGRKSQISYGDPSFATDWWDNNTWPWATVRNLQNKTTFPGGPGSVLDFLKAQIVHCLEHHGLVPVDHISPNMDKKALARRMNKRGEINEAAEVLAELEGSSAENSLRDNRRQDDQPDPNLQEALRRKET